jgi:hypothetical protein
MLVKAIQGEEAISDALNAAKEATVKALVVEGIITQEQADNFNSEHIAIILENRRFFKHLFKESDTADSSKVAVVKIV